MEQLFTHVYDAPIGSLYLAVDRVGAVHRVGFDDFRPNLPARISRENKYACGELEFQLDEYFAGKRRHFDLQVAVEGTDFRKAVWGRLGKIAYGHTMSYSTLAQKIGRHNAARAVGQAVGANPVLIVVPCHRIVKSDGSPGSYARKELPDQTGRTIKEYLLTLERNNL